MKYAYEDLSSEQFEKLIVLLCQELLGASVQGFAAGPDGGRDGKFVGTAQLHPSKAAPWKGITIIQAKHTNGHNKHFSEADFYSANSDSTVLGKEIPRIKKLKEDKQMDHYMMFANRRLTGDAESEIREHIAQKCGIAYESLFLCGIEQLELWLKRFPEVPKIADLDPINSPLMVSPDDLAEVVQALGAQTQIIVTVLDDPPTQRVDYKRKNALNNMSEEYAKAQRQRYLKETSTVRNFLSAPENFDLLRLYESVVDEFQLKIITKRQDFHTFDAVMEYLVDLLFNRDVILRKNKRLTRVMLFYMYWNCDIGRTDDSETN